MSFAFSDGPDSGVIRSADASGARARECADDEEDRAQGERSQGPQLYLLAPGELRLALDERADSLLGKSFDRANACCSSASRSSWPVMSG